MNRARGGFTLVEVLVAVVVLGVGITALVGSAGMVTRMVGRGNISTRAAQVATSRLERLRVAARSTSPRCTSGTFANGSATSRGVTESWVVPGAGTVRTVTVTVSYTKLGGTHSDTLTTRIEC